MKWRGRILPVADRSKFADTDLKAAAKGLYVIRDFTPGKPKHGYVIVQGSSSTVNLVKTLGRLDEAGINVKVISAISEDLFDRQPEAYRRSVLPPEAYYDVMVVSTGTRRMWPVRDLGPLTDDYSLTSDWDNQWLTGGLEADVIAEAHLDPESIFAGIQRFANERGKRIGSQRDTLGARLSVRGGLEQLQDLFLVIGLARQGPVEVSDIAVFADQECRRQRLNSTVEHIHFFIAQNDRVIYFLRCHVGVDNFPSVLIHRHAEHGETLRLIRFSGTR